LLSRAGLDSACGVLLNAERMSSNSRRHSADFHLLAETNRLRVV
jgi:hypothetical protein